MSNEWTFGIDDFEEAFDADEDDEDYSLSSIDAGFTCYAEFKGDTLSGVESEGLDYAFVSNIVKAANKEEDLWALSADTDAAGIALIENMNTRITTNADKFINGSASEGETLWILDAGVPSHKERDANGVGLNYTHTMNLVQLILQKHNSDQVVDMEVELSSTITSRDIVEEGLITKSSYISVGFEHDIKRDEAIDKLREIEDVSLTTTSANKM